MLTFVPQEIEEYASRHTTPLSPLLAELSEATRERTGGMALMLSGQIVGTLLQVLVSAIGARRALDIGTFTGFSALMMAAGLPEDGQVITLERDPKSAAIARDFFARSPHGHKIELREGTALDTLRDLAGPFDFVFIDADKENYVAYYEAVLPKLSPHGLIAVDNVLFAGRILDPQDQLSRAIDEFNRHVQQDPRVTNVILTVRDGVMLIRPTGGT